CARETERGAPTRDGERGSRASKHAVSPPVLGEFDSGTHQTATILFELRLKARKQGKRVSRGPGKARQDLIVVDLPHFAGVMFHDGIVHAHLAVSGHGDASVFPNTQNSGTADHGGPSG